MEIIEFMSEGIGLVMLLSVLSLLFGGITFLVIKSPKRKYAGRILIPLFLLEAAIAFFLLALSFPRRGEVGPAVVPILWLVAIAALSVILLVRGLLGREEDDPAWGRVDVVLIFFAMTIVYLILMQFIGYILATFLFIFASMYYLSYRKWLTVSLIAIGWIGFSYFAFFRLLYVPLPRGSLIEWIFG
ncbi:MAG: tripartite tricarboxylate transporter TctB family protein [Spirochaetales bacterium]|jgi:hypothetical protein|nr:tripartite tricarboxylate transporter TctB family protein [Spirochaetales bacterium]